MLGLISQYTPDTVPPSNQAVEVGNNDAWKPHGLSGPVVAYSRSFPGGVRPWLASVRVAARRHGPEFSQVRGGLRAAERRAGSQGMSRCSRWHSSRAAS